MTFQLGAYMLDVLVLSIISKEDAYGYMISQEIKKVINLKESTLYPVLRRLQEEGYLETYDQAFQGRNRKYYHITDAGRRQHDINIENWNEYKDKIDNIILKGEVK